MHVLYLTFQLTKIIMHQITADFQNLDIFLEETPELMEYLTNPIVNQEVKSGDFNENIKITT